MHRTFRGAPGAERRSPESAFLRLFPMARTGMKLGAAGRVGGAADAEGEAPRVAAVVDPNIDGLR